MSATTQPPWSARNSNTSISTSSSAAPQRSSGRLSPHVEFDSLDDDSRSLIQVCRWVLAAHSGCQLGTTIGLLIAMQAKWSSDDCSELNVYSSGDSILCEIGLPLFAFATFYVVVAMVMSALGLYGAWSVRRFFLSIFLVMSLSLMVFFLFTFTLVVAMAMTFVPYGLITLLLLLFSGVPVATGALLLRFKSLDGDDTPSASMLETVVVATRPSHPPTTTGVGGGGGGGGSGSSEGDGNESMFFASRPASLRDSPREGDTLLFHNNLSLSPTTTSAASGGVGGPPPLPPSALPKPMSDSSLDISIRGHPTSTTTRAGSPLPLLSPSPSAGATIVTSNPMSGMLVHRTHNAVSNASVTSSSRGLL